MFGDDIEVHHDLESPAHELPVPQGKDSMRRLPIYTVCFLAIVYGIASAMFQRLVPPPPEVVSLSISILQSHPITPNYTQSPPMELMYTRFVAEDLETRNLVDRTACGVLQLPIGTPLHIAYHKVPDRNCIVIDQMQMLP